MRSLFTLSIYCTIGSILLMQGCTADQYATLQVGFWDGSVAVVRLQPGTAPTPATPVALQGQGQAPAGKGADRALQHDMVLLVHFQVDATALRAVAWCSPQVIDIPLPLNPILSIPPVVAAPGVSLGQRAAQKPMH